MTTTTTHPTSTDLYAAADWTLADENAYWASDAGQAEIAASESRFRDGAAI